MCHLAALCMMPTAVRSVSTTTASWLLSLQRGHGLEGGGWLGEGPDLSRLGTGRNMAPFLNITIICSPDGAQSQYYLVIRITPPA